MRDLASVQNSKKKIKTVLHRPRPLTFQKVCERERVCVCVCGLKERSSSQLGRCNNVLIFFLDFFSCGLKERSFDPELLVQMSEKSFDPEGFDADSHSLSSQKSFDPEVCTISRSFLPLY